MISGYAASNIRRPYEPPPPLPPEYIGSNLLDEFRSNRGFNIRTDNATLQSQTGNINGFFLTATTQTEPKPVNGVLQLTGISMGFTWPSNPGIPATDFTAVYHFAPNVVSHGRRAIFFDTSAGQSPRVMPLFEVSAAVPRPGLVWDSSTYDFGAAFPFNDADDHVFQIKFEFSGGFTTATATLDNVLFGTPITGLVGQFTANTVISSRRDFRGSSSTTDGFNAPLYNRRYYKEALSDYNTSILHHVDSTFRNPAAANPAVKFEGRGQSQYRGITPWDMTALANNYPQLLGNIARCKIWNFTTRTYLPMNTTNNSLANPLLSMAYTLSQARPDLDFFFENDAVVGTNLFVNWAPGPDVAQQVRINAETRELNAKTWLDVEQRSYSVFGDWNQFEGDALNNTYGDAYAVNEPVMIANWRISSPGLSKILIEKGNPTMSISTYPKRDVVNAAKEHTVNGDGVVTFGDPDAILYTPTPTATTDGTHYNQDGMIVRGIERANEFLAFI